MARSSIDVGRMLCGLALIFAVSCANQYWVREGSGRSDLEAERKLCIEESGNTSGVMNLRTSRFVDECLKQRGWTVSDTPPPPDALIPRPASTPDPRNDFDACFARCRELTDRTKEQCFDTCLKEAPGE